MTHVNLEDLYQLARDNFPYELDPTGYSQGDFEPSDGMVEYGEEFTFDLCKLADSFITAGGWIELRQDTPDEEPIISGLFSLAYNGDFEKGLLLRDYLAIQGQYDIETQQWDIYIDSF